MKTLVLAGVLTLSPMVALAGEQANAPTVTGETGLFTLYTGDTLPQGEWSFGIYASNWDRLTNGKFLRPNGDIEQIGIDITRVSASVGYGLTDRWELSVMVPYDDINRGAPLSDEAGLNNVRVATKFRLFGASGDDSRLAINLFAEPKTSNNDLHKAGLAGKGGFGGGFDWTYENWTLNAGYRDPGGDLDNETILGAGYAGAISERLDWITELVGTLYSGGEIRIKNAIDLTSGGRLWFSDDRWAFNFALRADLDELSNFDKRCPIGGLVGLTYFPRFGHAKAAPMPEPAPAPAPPPPPPAPEPAPAPAPAPAPPPPAPAPAPEQRETINFGPNSARLSNIAKAKLDEVALKMKQDPSLTAQVLGYTDVKGSASANQKLSQARADAVKAYLMKRHGIDGSRITATGMGSADSTGDAVADRRAVIILKLQ